MLSTLGFPSIGFSLKSVRCTNMLQINIKHALWSTWRVKEKTPESLNLNKYCYKNHRKKVLITTSFWLIKNSECSCGTGNLIIWYYFTDPGKCRIKCTNFKSQYDDQVEHNYLWMVYALIKYRIQTMRQVIVIAPATALSSRTTNSPWVLSTWQEYNSKYKPKRKL